MKMKTVPVSKRLKIHRINDLSELRSVSTRSEWPLQILVLFCQGGPLPKTAWDECLHLGNGCFLSFGFVAVSVADSVDMLRELLLGVRRPQSIQRFKRVSKHWHTVISDSYFINKYTKRNSPD